MVLERIRVHDFRNIEEIHFEPSLGINAFYGMNGHGKTSLLEAIHFLAEGRSHRPVPAHDIVRRGSSAFSVAGDVRAALGNADHLRVSFHSSERHFTINEHPDVPLERYLGHLRVVTHSPEDSALLLGPPEARRRFLNRILVLTSPDFYRTLLRYVRSLKNRNRCLKTHASSDELATWTELLVQAGAKILAARVELVARLRAELASAVSAIASSSMPVSIHYRTARHVDLDPMTDLEAAELLRAQSASCAAHEIRFERTLFGPHLDDLQVALDSGSARRHGSQGERRTILIALRLAERSVIATATSDDPVFLLDDLSNELDHDRARHVIDVVAALPGQTFLTATSPPRIDGRTRLFRLESGSLTAPSRRPDSSGTTAQIPRRLPS